MIKRIIAFILVLVLSSLLMCSAVSASIYDTNNNRTKVVPQLGKGYYSFVVRFLNSVPRNGTYNAYIAVYNNDTGRMIDLQYQPIDTLALTFNITPREYPARVKVFVWSSSKAGIPYAESYEGYPILENANTIIATRLEGFLSFLNTHASEGGFVDNLYNVLDDIDEDIINDAKNSELIIDKAHLEKEYPDAYAKIQKLAKELKQSGEIDMAISELNSIINKAPEENNQRFHFNNLVLTLFKLLGVYDYF